MTTNEDRQDRPIEPLVRCGTMLLWAGVIRSVDEPVRETVIDGVRFFEPVQEAKGESSAPSVELPP